MRDDPIFFYFCILINHLREWRVAFKNYSHIITAFSEPVYPVRIIGSVERLD
jgi:hypothetical protein